MSDNQSLVQVRPSTIVQTWNDMLISGGSRVFQNGVKIGVLCKNLKFKEMAMKKTGAEY